MMYPWLDRGGRLAPLKAAVFGLLFMPAAVLTARAASFGLGPRPLTEIIHVTGLWGIRLLFLSLAVTPIRESWRWPRLILVRRMVGVAAFAYLTVHFSFYVADQGFDPIEVISEIVRRIYLTIGFVTLTILAGLAATSTDTALRRLGGRRWQRLHRLVYPAASLATIHFFMQSKNDVTEATVMAGLYAWLMLYRLAKALRPKGAAEPLRLAILAAAAAALTFGGEAAYFWLKSGVDPRRVLAADFSLLLGVRPGWIVFAITSAITTMALARRLISPAPARRSVS